MSSPAKKEPGHCDVCGSPIDGVLADLGCPVCLFQAGLGDQPDAGPQNARQFGSYAITEREDGTFDELGRGAMGITFRAQDTTLNRAVALKIIDPRRDRSDHARERFMRGARAAAGLRHPNVATIHHFGVHESTGQYYYAMELVEGETLEERVRRTGPLDARIVVAIAQQIVAALAAAEKRGLVHRDLKPGNIMLVANDTDALEVKIIDFGLARAVESRSDPMTITRDGGFVGSPAFASPEQFAHAPLDVRSDIYSLGVTLWFALTGKTPFAGHTLDAIQAAQKTNAVPFERLKAAGVPRRLIALLTSMLALEPAARPGVTELAQKLQRVANRKRSVLALAIVAVLLIATLFFFLRPPHESKPANAAASEAFLKGQFLWNRRTGPDFETAKIYFEKAIALDPNYAPAYAGLADTYQFIANDNRLLRADYYTKAKQLIRRALELDPNVAEAHAAAGLLAMNYDWDWQTAEREFKRAVNLNPNYATAHHWYATFLQLQGRFDEALREIELARRLDPLSGIINADVGQALIFAGHFSEAGEKLKETMKLDPTFTKGHLWLAINHILNARYDDATAELKILEREDSQDVGTSWQGYLGMIYGLTGRREEAEKIVSVLQKRYQADPTSDHISLMLVYIGLDRKDEAFAELEGEYRWRSTAMTTLKTNPVYNRLRADPRFLDLMQRVHLVPSRASSGRTE